MLCATSNHRKSRTQGAAMLLKAILFTLGCLVAWFVLLPVLLIVGGTALFAHAIFAELGALLTGNPGKTPDAAAAREIARRMCSGYGVHVRTTRRHPPALELSTSNSAVTARRSPSVQSSSLLE